MTYSRLSAALPVSIILKEISITKESLAEDHRVTGLLNAYRQENKDSYLNNDDDDTTLDERIVPILNVISYFCSCYLFL